MTKLFFSFLLESICDFVFKIELAPILLHKVNIMEGKEDIARLRDD